MTAALKVSGRLCDRESTVAQEVSGRLFDRDLTAALKWSASAIERRDRDRLFDREA